MYCVICKMFKLCCFDSLCSKSSYTNERALSVRSMSRSVYHRLKEHPACLLKLKKISNVNELRLYYKALITKPIITGHKHEDYSRLMMLKILNSALSP